MLVRVLSGVLLVIVAALMVARAAVLIGGGPVERLATEVEERRWFQWAYKDPSFARRLREASSDLESGAPLHIIPGAGNPKHPWMLVMARYELLTNPITVEGEALPPPGARVVDMSLNAGQPADPQLPIPSAALAIGVILVSTVGLVVVSAFGVSVRESATVSAGLSMIVGLTVLVPPLTIVRLAGLRLGPGSVVLSSGIIITIFSLTRSARRSAPLPALRAEQRLDSVASAVAGAACALAIWKVAVIRAISAGR